MSGEYDDVATNAATEAGEWLGEKLEVAGPVGDAVAYAAQAGVAIGNYINEATDNVLVDEGSDLLLDIVGDERSYAASQAFDDGDYLAVAGHMFAGAGESLVDVAGDAVDAVGDFISDIF